MNNTQKLLLLASVFLMSLALVFHLDPSLVRAQDDAISKTDQINLTKEELSQHIKSLQKLYTDQIEAYRVVERQYILELTQYRQLETLSSKEKAVSATVRANFSRADVLISYFELLHARMVAADGMSLDDKEKLSPQIIQMIEQLKAHKLEVTQVVNKEQVNQLADNFEPLFETATELSIRTQFMLDVAQLNSAKEDAEDLFFRLKTRQEELPLSELKRAERSRAYEQIDSLFAQIKTQVIEQNEIAILTGSDFRKQQRKLGGILSGVEVNLLKVLNYLSELANIL